MDSAYALPVRRLRAYLVRFRRELSALCAGVVVLTLGNHLHPLHSHRVWVARHAIPAGQAITSAALIPADSTLDWEYLIRSADQVVGRVAARDIAAGEPVTTRSVIAPSALDGSGRVALTLEVTKADAQLVRSGDRIDVLAADGNGLATTVATNAAVVSVPASDVVVVAVNPTEAVKVAGARAASTFTLVLRAAS